MPAPIVHFEIGCQNLDKTKAFYAETLGWEFAGNSPQMAMLGNIGPMAPQKTEGIGGHLSSLGHPPHQYVTVYAQVPDIGATLAKVTSAGGKVVVPKTEVPQMGYFAWFADPEGNVVGLWTPMSR